MKTIFNILILNIKVFLAHWKIKNEQHGWWHFFILDNIVQVSRNTLYNYPREHEYHVHNLIQMIPTSKSMLDLTNIAISSWTYAFHYAVGSLCCSRVPWIFRNTCGGQKSEYNSASIWKKRGQRTFLAASRNSAVTTRYHWARKSFLPHQEMPSF